MLTAISYKTKQFLLAPIKLSLVIAVFYFIYVKIFQNETLSFAEFSWNLMKLRSISLSSILMLIFLSLFNWIFEIQKWQTLASPIREIPFKEASSQTLGSLTVSLLTPNRMGEYGVKAMHFQAPFRKQIMFLNFIGNSMQMAVTTLFGTVGLIYFVRRFQPELNEYAIIMWFAGLGALCFSSILILKSHWLKNQKNRIFSGFHFIKSISYKIMIKVALYSSIRYLIFSFQFYYLLILFGVELGYFEAMAVISSMYLLSSVIPSIFIFDVLIKGGVAVYMFGLIGIPEFLILSIITLMWILNFVLPSVIGGYYVLRFKLPKATI